MNIEVSTRNFGKKHFPGGIQDFLLRLGWVPSPNHPDAVRYCEDFRILLVAKSFLPGHSLLFDAYLLLSNSLKASTGLQVKHVYLPRKEPVATGIVDLSYRLVATSFARGRPLRRSVHPYVV